MNLMKIYINFIFFALLIQRSMNAPVIPVRMVELVLRCSTALSVSVLLGWLVKLVTWVGLNINI